MTKSINNTNNNNPDTTTPTTINNPTTTTHPTPSNSSHLIAYQTPPSAPNTTPHTPYVSVGMTLSSGHKGPFRKSSFRRTSSNKSAMEKINEEDSTERSYTYLNILFRIFRFCHYKTWSKSYLSISE